MDYRKIITVDPKVRNGQPCVRGMPITVREIVEALASGKTMGDVLATYLKLTREDIQACLGILRGRRLMSMHIRGPTSAWSRRGWRLLFIPASLAARLRRSVGHLREWHRKDRETGQRALRVLCALGMHRDSRRVPVGRLATAEAPPAINPC